MRVKAVGVHRYGSTAASPTAAYRSTAQHSTAQHSAAGRSTAQAVGKPTTIGALKARQDFAERVQVTVLPLSDNKLLIIRCWVAKYQRMVHTTPCTLDYVCTVHNMYSLHRAGT